MKNLFNIFFLATIDKVLTIPQITFVESTVGGIGEKTREYDRKQRYYYRGVIRKKYERVLKLENVSILVLFLRDVDGRTVNDSAEFINEFVRRFKGIKTIKEVLDKRVDKEVLGRIKSGDACSRDIEHFKQQVIDYIVDIQEEVT